MLYFYFYTPRSQLHTFRTGSCNCCLSSTEAEGGALLKDTLTVLMFKMQMLVFQFPAQIYPTSLKFEARTFHSQAHISNLILQSIYMCADTEQDAFYH